jgi:hypothetical protein
MHRYDKSHYYKDFSNSTLLTDDEKRALETIQNIYRPIERAEFLIEYIVSGKITSDDYELLTGIPYSI